MRYKIIKDGNVIDYIEADSESEAMDGAFAVTDGNFDDVVKEYKAGEFVDPKDFTGTLTMPKPTYADTTDPFINIQKKPVLPMMSPEELTSQAINSGLASPEYAYWASQIAPYSTESNLRTGDFTLGTAMKDISSLPGRFLMSGVSDTDMATRSGQRGFIGNVATDPTLVPSILGGMATGGMAPLSSMATKGVISGAGMGGGALTFNALSGDNISEADAVATLLMPMVVGGAFGKAADSIRNGVVKYIQSKYSNFTPDQVEYVMSKLGVSTKGTLKKLEQGSVEQMGTLRDLTGRLNAGELNLTQPAFWTKANKEPIKKAYETILNNARRDRVNPMSKAELDIKTKLLDDTMASLNDLTDRFKGNVPADRIIAEAQIVQLQDPELANLIMQSVNDVVNKGASTVRKAGEEFSTYGFPSEATNLFNKMKSAQPQGDIFPAYNKYVTGVEYGKNPIKPTKITDVNPLGFGTMIPNISPERAMLAQKGITTITPPAQVIATQDQMSPMRILSNKGTK